MDGRMDPLIRGGAHLKMSLEYSGGGRSGCKWSESIKCLFFNICLKCMGWGFHHNGFKKGGTGICHVVLQFLGYGPGAQNYSEISPKMLRPQYFFSSINSSIIIHKSNISPLQNESTCGFCLPFPLCLSNPLPMQSLSTANYCLCCPSVCSILKSALPCVATAKHRLF